jgi:hypothetical protein
MFWNYPVRRNRWRMRLPGWRHVEDTWGFEMAPAGKMENYLGMIIWANGFEVMTTQHSLGFSFWSGFASPSEVVKSVFVGPAQFHQKKRTGGITFFKRGPADPSQQWKRASNSIQDPTPHWILVILKLKFCWKERFPLIVTSIVQWRNFKIIIEVTTKIIVNLLWLILQKEITLWGHSWSHC